MLNHWWIDLSYIFLWSCRILHILILIVNHACACVCARVHVRAWGGSCGCACLREHGAWLHACVGRDHACVFVCVCVVCKASYLLVWTLLGGKNIWIFSCVRNNFDTRKTKCCSTPAYKSTYIYFSVIHQQPFIIVLCWLLFTTKWRPQITRAMCLCTTNNF